MPNEDTDREARMLARSHAIYSDYMENHETPQEALMAASVKLAKLEFAEEARLNKEKKWPF